MELFIMFQFLIIIPVIVIVIAWLRTMPTLPPPKEIYSNPGFSQSISDELDPQNNDTNDEFYFFFKD